MKCMLLNKQQRKHFGEAVRKRRHSKEWTIAYLAEIADLDPSFVGRVELGNKGISLMTYLYLSAAFGLTDPTILMKESLGELYETLLEVRNEIDFKSVSAVNRINL